MGNKLSHHRSPSYLKPFRSVVASVCALVTVLLPFNRVVGASASVGRDTVSVSEAAVGFPVLFAVVDTPVLLSKC